MKLIRKFRRESFGGIIFSEHPGFMAFVDDRYANRCGIPTPDNLPRHCLSAPIDVHMSVTTRCNLACPGCHISNASNFKQDIDFEAAIEIVDNLARLDIFTIALGGGEPFLYPHIFELAGYIRQQRIVPSVTTNGTLIDHRIAAQCHVFGNIHLSLHNLDEIGRLGTAIHNLQREGIQVGLNVLLTSQTIEHLEAIFRWAASVKIDELLLLRFKTDMSCDAHERMEISAHQEQTLWPRVQRLSRQYKITPMFDCSLFLALAIHKLPKKHLQASDVNGCQGGNMYIAIDVNGDYKPCSFWPDVFGKAASLSCEEWSQSDLLNSFRGMGEEKACASCEYIVLCNYGCRLIKDKVCAHALEESR